MRTRVDFMAARLPIALATVGCDVGLTWQTWASGSGVSGSGANEPDAVDGLCSGTPISHTETVRALVHFAGGSTQLRQFTEIEAGDCLLDLSPEVVLRGRAGLRFTIAGEEWSMKPISSALAQIWDVQVANQKLFQTVLLRKAT